MRDFRDAKAMAQTLRAALAAKGYKLSIGESLELTAKAFGAPDWNTLSAAIKAAEASPREPPAPTELAASPQPAPGMPEPNRRTSFSPALEATLHRAVAAAATREHGYTALEHLLLALIDDADASAVLEACQADLGALRATLTTYIDDELKSLAGMGEAPQAPTAGFHRVIQRAVIHVQASGRGMVTGANVLVAIFSERESHAAHFLQQQHVDRFDAVNFIAHGVRKDGGRAA